MHTITAFLAVIAAAVGVSALSVEASTDAKLKGATGVLEDMKEKARSARALDASSEGSDASDGDDDDSTGGSNEDDDDSDSTDMAQESTPPTEPPTEPPTLFAGPCTAFMTTGWCLQGPTNDQFTRCESVSNGGLTCHNPEIKYGTTEGGYPFQHSNNDYDSWCQQLFGNVYPVGSVTFSTTADVPTKCGLFWCDQYDDTNTFHWCDWQDGFWRNTGLGYCSHSMTDRITALTCAST